MSEMPTRTVIVGAFPPPVHGKTAVNAVVREQLERAGAQPVVVNIAGTSLNRALVVRLARIPRVIRGLVRLANFNHLSGGTLYMSLSGGLGQAYEILFLLIARQQGMRVFLHHHSWAYLDRLRWSTRSLTWLAGKNTVHITQSNRMAQRLMSMYRVSQVVPVSNVVFLEAPKQRVPVRTDVKTLGYLSNISKAKGVFEFLDLMEAARDRGLSLRALLAGPFTNAKIERQVSGRIALLPNVEYVGPKHKAAKTAFFSQIDVLIFPTRYPDETEGIVNHEAMKNGVPVIAHGRGAIPEIIGPDCGLVVHPAAPFVPAALEQLELWLRKPTSFEAASVAAASRFAQTYKLNAHRWATVLAEMSTGHTDGEESRVTEQ